MASKTANVNSISSFTEGESITILGKNGFSSIIGSIPVLCTAVSYNTSDIGLTLKGLQHITDLNHEEHILAVNDGQIFLSIGSEEPTVQALHARPDLTRFYLVGDTNDTVFQYYLDVPGDISTGRVLKNPFSVSNKETQPRGITFSTTGAYMYVIGSASDSIHQYRLSNPWELATAKFLATKSIQSQTTDPRGIFFKYDGTYCYVVDTATVFQYKLTNPWDITSAALENSKTITTFSGTGASAVDYVKSIYISPAGDYFFLTNGGAAGKTNAIYKYTMSESWNVISGSYSTQSLNINSRENNPGGLVFKGDGSKLYVSGAQGDDVTEFSLSTPWDLTSATYVTDSLNNTNETGTTGMYISSDGTQVYLTGTTLDTVKQYRLSTPWDTSTGSFANANLNILSLTGEGQSKGLFIPENGGNVYVTGSLNDRVYQIKLGDPFNFSNITSITNYDISSRETNPQGIFFKPDGTKMFVAGQTNATSIAGNTIYEYSLSKPWNVETSTFSGFYNITQGVNPGITDFFIREDGERLYVTGTTDNKIYPYRLNTPWSIASAEWLASQLAVDTLLGETDPTGIYLSKGGTRCYIAGTSADKIFQTQLSDKWDITTLKYATSSFGGVRGEDYVSIPLTVTNDKILGQVGYVNLLEETSIKIKEYNLSDSSSNIVISEGTSNSSGLVATSIPSERLSSKLPTVPFLVKLPQHITSRYFDARSLYVEGTRKKVQKTFDVTGIQGVYSANLALIPLGQSFIKAYLDNIDVTNTITWNGEYSISLPISTEHVELKTIVDYYTVPAIEANDYVVIYDDFKFKVSNVSYLHTDPEYNTYLTSNSVYRIKLDKSIDSRIRTGNQIINITDDLIGTVGNLNSTVSTISIDYDEEKYPYTYNLSNHKIYAVTTGSNKFNRINLGSDRTIKDVKPGYYTFRAKNITSLNRQSPISSASIYLRPIPIGKVDDLTLTESYFIDTGQAAVTRMTVSFTHLADQNVTDYEISFKIVGSASDLTTFNTVKVSAAGVESDGKIRYVINNVDRGPTSAGYTLVVRVTPLNGDKRGVTAEKSQAIIGKLAQPKTVLLFNARQFQDSIFFSYKVPTVRDQTGSGSEVNPYDIDLNYIDIRRIPGSCTAPTSTNWSTDATEIIRAPTPSTGAQAPVTTIGTYTYLAKTVDTSGNESAEIAYATLTTIESPDIAVANTYDEANPSGNNITSVDNSNYREYYWPSFSNSTNGGLSVPGAGSADNANGTSSGWSQGADIDLTTIFTTGATANYQTKVRTLESVRTGSVKINYDYSTIFTGDYNSLRSNIINGTTSALNFSNVSISTAFTVSPPVLAIQSDGTLWGWGASSRYQLGLGTTTARRNPTQVGTATWKIVSTEDYHTAAIKSDDTLWTWGVNDKGQLGQGDTTTRSVPTQVGSNTWKRVDVGTRFTVAIKSDDTLWTWGYNNVGQLGQGDTTDRISPTQVGSANWKQVNAGGSHALAIKSDDTLWSWGSNGVGQLGQGDTTDRASPTQIGSSTWKYVNTGAGGYTAAIKSDDTLWTWGYNNVGQLGLGDTTQRTSPTQVGSSYWKLVSVGYYTTMAIKTDGTLWGWGRNDYGQLGDGTTTQRTSPVQIGSDTDWAWVAAGAFYTIAIKTNGSIWSCGAVSSPLGLGSGFPSGSTLTTLTRIGTGIIKASGLSAYLSDATYDSVNKTLSNGSSSGNVFAIWNTNTNIGNSNSYALIAGILGTDTVALSNTYFANGSPTYSNAFPNLTTAYTGAYSLVNLQQYNDDASLTYQGSPDAVSTRLYYRYSDDASAFHANSNLILENFSSFTELSGGVIPQLTFKHLQLRLDFKNTNPSTTSAQLTDFNYYLQLTKIPYVDTITLDTNPKTIDYSSKNFSVVPEITAIVPINVGYAVAPEVTSISTTQATIKVYKISDSSLPTGIQVTVKAEGA